jgi:hypothetical protein
MNGNDPKPVPASPKSDEPQKPAPAQAPAEGSDDIPPPEKGSPDG